MFPSARPRLHLRRLAQAPSVHLAAIEGTHTEATHTEDTQTEFAPVATLALRGVVCGLCAARTRAALAAVPGVRDVEVDLDGSRATVRFSPGARIEVGDLQRALERVVAGMPVRRFIERLARRWSRAPGHATDGSGRAA